MEELRAEHRSNASSHLETEQILNRGFFQFETEIRTITQA